MPLGTTNSIGSHSHFRPFRPATAPHRTSQGLTALGNTLDKLAQDKDRSDKLLSELASKIKLTQTVTEHTSKSFAQSGYTFVKELAQGRFGTVKLAKKKSNEFVSFTSRQMPAKGRNSEEQIHSPFVAVRIIPRYHVRTGRLVMNEVLSSAESHATLMKQIKALRELDHPHICREYETFEDSQSIYIVMELYTGGSLLTRELSGQNPLDQDRCMHYMRQIISAMAHAHEKNIVHQDLRPEQILFASEDADARLVVTDWNYAEFIDTPPRDSRKNLPISDFSAPELDPMRRTDRVDVWSMGVIAFALLTYRLPFDEPAPNDAVQWDESDAVSSECRELVNSMLKKNPMERPSAKDLLGSPLLTKDVKPKHRESKINVPQALVNFAGKSRLQKAAATFAAAHLSGQELHELSLMFESIDKNGDGCIDTAELEAAFGKLGWADNEETNESEASKKEKLSVLIHGLDTDGSGQISYSEFLSAAADAHMQSHVELCYEAFRAFDRDGSGQVSRAEIDHMMSSPEIGELFEAIKRTNNQEAIQSALNMIGKDTMDDVDSKTLLSKLDEDGNQNISFEEFLHAILGAPDGAGDPKEHPMSKAVEKRRATQEKSKEAMPERAHTSCEMRGNARGSMHGGHFVPHLGGQ